MRITCVIVIRESSLIASALPWSSITSEVPQGSIVGPLFSLPLPCSDLPFVVSSGDRVLVAQLFEHRAAMRVVVSSTPAGPTLRVLK